ncbi:methyl-accepting chemotaxis protein [Halomonas sp. CnH100-B]|uniref:methyl-accepting chemotaxis protein n=1 Tax=Halomonas sp. CnH100-B TaxID=2954490 RepID=UPI0025B787FB|nr:methyl-accepting chemotaxis protein [Halomonas sp. CnH100-B]
MLYLKKSVKRRLAVSLGVCVVMLIAVGVFGLYHLSKMNDAITQTFEGNVLTLIDLGKVNEALLSTRVKITAEQRDRNPASAVTTQQEIAENDVLIDAAWNDYFPQRVSDEVERGIAEEFIASLAVLRAGIDEVNAAMIDNDFDAARSIATTTLRAAYPQVLDTLHALIDRNSAQAASAHQQTSEDYVWTRNIVIGVIAGAVIVGILLAIWLIRGIMTPLGKAQALANAMAQGQLDNAINITCQDEFGDMLRSLKAMEVKVSQVVMSVRHNAESVNGAAEEIAHGTEDLSSRTQQQAASIEETAASMDEITSTVRQNADNASEAEKLVHAVTQQANAGGEIASNAVNAMEGINASSRKIAGIVGLIDQIAFQTNLLALNASVEAARAGENGRGFAVVAGEVRNLAGRSANAAKEIKQLVEESIDLVGNGSTLVNQAGKALEDIVIGVQRVSLLMGEIATASHEQSQGIDQVNTAVAQLDSVTQQNASLVEESSAACRSLQIQAEALMKEVAFFKGGAAEKPQAALPSNFQRPVVKPLEKTLRPPLATRQEAEDWASF